MMNEFLWTLSLLLFLIIDESHGALTISRPEGDVGIIMVSSDDIEDDDSKTFTRLMVFFDYECLDEEAGFENTIQSVQQSKIDSLISSYSCLEMVGSNHFPRPWHNESVTYLDITDIVDVSTDYENSCIFDSNINIDYNALCINMFYHDATVELSGYPCGYPRQTSDEYECICQNTGYGWLPIGETGLSFFPPAYTAWGLDQIDDEILNNKYCYPNMENADNGVDLYILDTGIRDTHQEFVTGQVQVSSSFTPASVTRPSGHGTHVAGTAGGLKYGASKHVATIYDYQVFATSLAQLADVEAALSDIYFKLAANNRRGVINLSLGGANLGTAWQNMFDGYFNAIQGVGGVIVSSAGNLNVDVTASNFYPAGSPYSISVGAVGLDLVKASYSNYGSQVDVWAPGGAGTFDSDGSDEITSAWDSSDIAYAGIAGTSMASPHIAGIIANLLHVDPELTQSQVLNLLLSNTLTVTGGACDSQTCLFPMYSCGDCDLPQYVKCEEDPCNCNSDDDPHCKVCDANGCDQCKDGYFKKDYDYPCTSCSEVFGDGCMFCQDFNGCGQCEEGYQRVLDEDCGLWKCVEDSSEILIPCAADVIFGIDESGSITNSGLFPSETSFVNDVIDILAEDANIGALTFATVARSHYELDDDQTRNVVRGAINAISPSGGGTLFNPALTLGQSMFAAGSVDNPDVFILVTDGVNSDANDACTTAATMRANGITIIVAGIGSGFNQNSASVTCLVDDASSQIFKADSFSQDDLKEILFDVARAACGGDCPIECNNNPCSCSEMAHCKPGLCHANGCDQCEDGYFKKQYNYLCEDCQLITGSGCMFCQDFNGCGQCKQGYYRVFDNECGLWVCR